MGWGYTIIQMEPSFPTSTYAFTIYKGRKGGGDGGHVRPTKSSFNYAPDTFRRRDGK